MDSSSFSVLGLGLTSYLVVILKDIPKKIWDAITLLTSFSCSIKSKDSIAYQKLLEFIYNLNSKTIKNHISVETTKDEKEEIIFSLDYGTFTIMPSFLTFIKITKEQIKETYNFSDLITIKIFGKKKNHSQLLRKELSSIIQINKLLVYPYKHTWDFKRLNKRYMESLFIEKENYDKLNKAITLWKNDKIKQIYTKVGIVHKLGILLYGLPGTGKTSIAKILASELNYSLHIINLEAYSNEEELLNRICCIKNNSIILFEDIDLYLTKKINQEKIIEENNNIKNDSSANEPKSDSNSKKIESINLGMLLNIFDGILSPENCIFIITTNHIELLDSSLLRPGRFDVKVELNNISKEVAINMCNYYGIKHNILDKESFPINPAYLQNKVFQELQFGNNIKEEL
jgi:ATP-dependent Zn protease